MVIMVDTVTEHRTIASVRDFAIIVRDARLSLKLTQEELSQQTGIPRPWISQLEMGRIDNPGLERCLTLCSALGISMRVEYTVQSPIIAWEREHADLLRQFGYPKPQPSDQQPTVPQSANLQNRTAPQNAADSPDTTGSGSLSPNAATWPYTYIAESQTGATHARKPRTATASKSKPETTPEEAFAATLLALKQRAEAVQREAKYLDRGTRAPDGIESAS